MPAVTSTAVPGADILIVEDSSTQAAQLRFVLEEHGFNVRHGRHGGEALALLEQRLPLAVISDINMPEMDGYELCRRIRARAATANLPIILLTSLSDPEDVLLALEGGADYFFTKPLDEGLLIPRLRYIQANPQLRALSPEEAPIPIRIGRGTRQINSSRSRTLNLLLSTYESAVAQNQRLVRTEAELRQLNENLEQRVRERTAELVRTNQSLQAENAARRQGEVRLREQAELLDKAAEAIITADLEQRIRFWNRGAERVFGRTAAEMVGRPVSEVFHLDGAGGDSSLPAAFKMVCDWRGELAGQRRTGERLTLDVSFTVLRDDHGSATGWLSISSDVTEKKKLEEKFLRAQRLESIGMLAAGIAHDLNNVLAPIGMASSILRTRLAQSADLRMIDTVEKSVARGASLVRQILGFAQGVSGERRVVQVKHLLRDVTTIITQTFPKSITLEEKVANDLWTVLGNPTQIHQVLLNLCVNARDAMPDGGRLVVRADNCRLDERAAGLIEHARPGAWLRLEVADSGTGIPPEILARIWDPFFTTKAADRGTGLGLSTVRGIVETHLGFITLESAPGVGTTFRVYLPAAEADGAGEDAVSSRPVIRGRGELILVVDDEEPIRDTVREILSAVGYQVLTANDGEAAAALFADHPERFSLVVSDFDMPRLDGGGLAKIVRMRQPGTKILSISGFASVKQGRRNDRLGFGDARLCKPFTAEALLLTVDGLLQGKSVAK